MKPDGKVPALNLKTDCFLGKKEKKLKKEEIRTGLGLEPSYVYKMLLNLASDTFKVG
jgi:predicted transcriptional regulator